MRRPTVGTAPERSIASERSNDRCCHSSPNRVALLPARRFPSDLDLVHAGTRGAATTPGDERLHPLPRTFEDSFQAAVRTVASPAGETERAGAISCLGPEEHSLHAAADDDVGASDFSRHYRDGVSSLRMTARPNSAAR